MLYLEVKASFRILPLLQNSWDSLTPSHWRNANMRPRLQWVVPGVMPAAAHITSVPLGGVRATLCNRIVIVSHDWLLAFHHSFDGKEELRNCKSSYLLCSLKRVFTQPLADSLAPSYCGRTATVIHYSRLAGPGQWFVEGTCWSA